MIWILNSVALKLVCNLYYLGSNILLERCNHVLKHINRFKLKKIVKRIFVSKKIHKIDYVPPKVPIYSSQEKALLAMFYSTSGL